MSPTRSIQSPQTSFEYSTENERPTSSSGSKRPVRPDSLRPSGFAPLRVIAEREGEHSTSSMVVQDIENGEEDQPAHPNSSKSSRPTRFGGSRETGV